MSQQNIYDIDEFFENFKVSGFMRLDHIQERHIWLQM